MRARTRKLLIVGREPRYARITIYDKHPSSIEPESFLNGRRSLRIALPSLAGIAFGSIHYLITMEGREAVLMGVMCGSLFEYLFPFAYKLEQLMEKPIIPYTIHDD